MSQILLTTFFLARDVVGFVVQIKSLPTPLKRRNFFAQTQCSAYAQYIIPILNLGGGTGVEIHSMSQVYHRTSAAQFRPQQNYRVYALLWGIHFLLGHAKWPPLPDCIQYQWRIQDFP